MKGKSRARANTLRQRVTGAWGQPEEPSGKKWEFVAPKEGGGCSPGVTNSFPAFPSLQTPGCAARASALACSLISASQQLCVHLLLCSIPSSLFQISSVVGSWAEGNIFFFSPQNSAIIYDFPPWTNHKRKRIYLKSMFKCESKCNIWKTRNIYSHTVCILGDKNSLFMKNTVLTQIPLFPLQHIH